ncbi:hypothetical protein [Streptomyces sp. NPDC090022]|uniref:hypothetical protein n=1 Tax=Streptomyces sp. NPDC090022 TaxID=3365920 RepID=UPI00380B78F3
MAASTSRLRPGYRADLLVVHGNPVEDLQNLRRVALVMSGGRVHIPRFPHTAG